MTLARLYLDEENWAKAIDVTSYVVEREPGAVDAAFMLAQAYEGAGKLNEAIAALEEATLVDPDSPRALHVSRRPLRPRAASTRKRPTRSTAPRRCGRACWISGCVRRARWSARGRAAAARDLLRETAELHAKEPRVLYLLAEVERSLQDYDGAEADRAQADRPRAEAAVRPARARAGLRAAPQLQGVIDTLTPVVNGVDQPTANSRPYAPIWVSLGYAHQELGDFDKAIASFERAKRAGGDDVSYDAYLVQANLAAGRTAEGRGARGGRARDAAEEPAPDESRSAGAPAARRFRPKAIEILEQRGEGLPERRAGARRARRRLLGGASVHARRGRR